MLPSQYFEVICCPRCRGNLVQVNEGQLCCQGCFAEYPVVEEIPVLLDASDDEVSRTVSSFYKGTWKHTAEERLVARVVHDDVSPYGERYVRRTEDRFSSVFQSNGRRRRFFLDAGCGTFPRGHFGHGHTYHVCFDFALEALIESRRALGERAVCICGSLLRAPLRDAVFDGILASHCIYHIDKDLQGVAIRELLRMLAPGGKLLIFYANPDNVSSQLLKRWRFWPLKALLLLSRRFAPPPATVVTDETPIYCYLHPIEFIRHELTAVHSDVRVAVKPLCLFQFNERAPLFQCRGLDALAYVIYMGLEKLYERRPDMSYYLAYVVDRAGQSPSGGVWINASSREHKNNIEALTTEEAIVTLQGLNPVKFAYKKDLTEKHVGFISDEVPELIATKDRKGLSPVDIVAVLTKVVQEQQKTISTLREELNELKEKVR